MFRRRRSRPSVPPALDAAYAAFQRVAGAVEGAKASLVAAAPTGRPARVSPAEALAGFEEGLRGAGEAMEGWRSAGASGVWTDCAEALAEAARRAERLRLEGSPQGYEELVVEIERLLDPLEAFGRADAWFRGAG